MAQLGKGLLGRLVGAGVAILVALGIGFVVNKVQEKDAEGDAPKVGECVNMTGSSVSANHEEISCDDALATYKIVSDDGSCGETELNYTISLGTEDTGNVADLCLALNATKGDCFQESGTTSPAKKVDCAASKGEASTVKVTKVGKPGDKCANPAQPWEFEKRDILLCLVPNA